LENALTSVTEPVNQSVLEAPAPSFTAEQIAAIALKLFGVAGRAVDLGSERDQTFLIDGDGAGWVLKISNAAEDEALLNLEDAAIAHIARVDPDLPVARPVPGTGRRTVEGPEGTHFVRLFERLPGASPPAAELSDDALREFGAMHARLNLAMRGFFHPAAGRELLWDLKQASKLRGLVGSIEGPRRALVTQVLDRYDAHVAPLWAGLRAQVVHGDFTLDNVLVDDAGHITAIVDFGDMSHTAEVGDLAIDLAGLTRGRESDEVFRAARLVIDGYESVRPLEPTERGLLGDLIAARLATLVAISAWRVKSHPENAEYIQAWDADSWAQLELFCERGGDAVAQMLGADPGPTATAALALRRQRVLGSALTELTYSDPVHLVRGEGVWLFDAQGRRLLDAYNNVPVAGHCHPRVTEAVVRQTRALNTHSRYLYEPLIELGERLVALMPDGSGLDTVMVVNSGSEANDLAWRIATACMDKAGAIVTSTAYHGMTAIAADLSPEEWSQTFRPTHVEQIEPPLSPARAVQEMSSATERLLERGHGLAATYIDGGFTSDGILIPGPGSVDEIARHTHEAGGLFVADEVQAGHGRTGRDMWSFATHGVVPDVVTLGKPMGNGYPVAAVITRKDLVDRFSARTGFFSTFGGNPVAATAALAVLDVIEDQRLIEHAGAVGADLVSQLEDLRSPHPAMSAVRGLGLLIGVELVDADNRFGSAGAMAGRVQDAMRDRGVLIGRTGPENNVLKIRPPLVFGHEHARLLVSTLDAVLANDLR
jgi:4-aminobutyrate aminotransferase-like enzyme/Ser/Thr protein kinase RdoA (MazF antagonist)